MQKVYKTTGNVLELPPRVSLFGGTTYNFSVQAIKKRNMVSIDIYQMLKSLYLREHKIDHKIDRYKLTYTFIIGCHIDDEVSGDFSNIIVNFVFCDLSGRASKDIY